MDERQVLAKGEKIIMSGLADSSGALQLRPLGTTGLSVTPLCIGCAPLGNMPDTFTYEVTEDRALATVRAVLDSSINFLDTAASYGDGESERRIGIVLRERGGLPPGVVLATKADRDLKSGEFSGVQMRRSIERSMRLLGLEKLQLVHLHDPEHITFEEAMKPGGPVEVLRQCKEEGLIEHLGVAGGPIDLTLRFLETGLFEAVITHNRYTLLNRDAEPVWELCQRENIIAFNAAPYGSGILAKGPSVYPRYMYEEAPADMVQRAQQMEEACKRQNVPLAAAALQFSLRDPRITSTIVGVSRPERLNETISLAQHPIPEELWAELDKIAFAH